jgi:hypothetical protein
VKPEDVRARLVAALEVDLIRPFDATTGQEVLPLPPSRFQEASSRLGWTLARGLPTSILAPVE